MVKNFMDHMLYHVKPAQFLFLAIFSLKFPGTTKTTKLNQKALWVKPNSKQTDYCHELQCIKVWNPPSTHLKTS